VPVLLIGEANLPEEACAEIVDKIDETGQATAAVKQAIPGRGARAGGDRLPLIPVQPGWRLPAA
jgi:hypothetical protein